MTRSREHGSDWKRGRAKRGSDAFLKSGGGCCAGGWEPYGLREGRGGPTQYVVALLLNIPIYRSFRCFKAFHRFLSQKRSLRR
jgi:hypothetical protein